MARRRAQSAWFLPTMVAILVSALGVAINFATDLKSSVVAWLAVVALTSCIAAATVVAERRGKGAESNHGTVLASASDHTSASSVYGLVMRRTVTANVDGSSKTVIDYFSEEVALQSLREDSLDDSTGEP
jgi:hypothetical protein